jgi:MoxR-like ATPase
VEGPAQQQRSPERGTGVILDFRDLELQQILASLAKGQGLLVLGESGSGKSELAAAVKDHFKAKQRVAIATYGGSAKQCLVDLAESLDVPTMTFCRRRLSWGSSSSAVGGCR